MHSPLSIAHHHVHIAGLNQFSAFFRQVPSFPFIFPVIQWAEPRVLVLGDSFIRRLPLFLSRDSYHFSVDFTLSHRVFIKWHGVGGRTVSKTLHLDLNVIESF